jgi:hypothetical protein
MPALPPLPCVCCIPAPTRRSFTHLRCFRAESDRVCGSRPVPVLSPEDVLVAYRTCDADDARGTSPPLPPPSAAAADDDDVDDDCPLRCSDWAPGEADRRCVCCSSDPAADEPPTLTLGVAPPPLPLIPLTCTIGDAGRRNGRVVPGVLGEGVRPIWPVSLGGGHGGSLVGVTCRRASPLGGVGARLFCLVLYYRRQEEAGGRVD